MIVFNGYSVFILIAEMVISDPTPNVHKNFYFSTLIEISMFNNIFTINLQIHIVM